MLTAYVHDWNPILLELGGPIAIRWYGLAYLLSFALGILLLKHLAKKKLWVLPEADVADFIAMAAMLGVFLGGRIGYVLFYMIPDKGLDYVLNDPLTIIRVWDGGMASHGGIFALIIFTFFYAKKKGVSWTGLGDGLCVVAPVGIFCVRMANFINGELYGRVDEACKWAVRFPNTLLDPRTPEYANSTAAAQAVMDVAPMAEGQSYNVEYAKSALREHPSLHETFEQLLMPRHPSQLYEGILEGALLFLILWVLRVSFPKLGNGILTGLFFILYALGRMLAEQFREPDSSMIGFLTKGQFYSTFMIAIGAAFLVWGFTKGKVKTLT